MQDFNEYARNGKSQNQSGNNSGLMDMVNALAKKFDGKNTNELIKAVYEEAKKGKQRGTLTNSDLDNFATMISPMLNDKQRKMLVKVVSDLKEI